MAAAAVLGQERQQAAHPLDVDRVEDPPLVAPRGRQSGTLELGQMRRQGRGRDGQPLGDLPGRQADCALADQEAEDLEPGRVRQGGKRLQGVRGLHQELHFVI